jgi:hypothetical protein
MNDDDYTSYGFMYRDCGGKVSNHEVKVDEITWPEVLNDFVDFLQNVYGYNIKDSIRIREPRYETFPESWSGEYFSEEE